MIVSDGDISANPVGQDGKSYEELGYNRFDRKIYANKTFLINSIEYLLDKNGVLESRTKEVKLRLLDRVRMSEEKTKWQLVNVVLPLVLIVLLGGLKFYLRKRKFTD